MIRKAASGSQQRQLVVSVDTAQLGTESQAEAEARCSQDREMSAKTN